MPNGLPEGQKTQLQQYMRDCDTKATEDATALAKRLVDTWTPLLGNPCLATSGIATAFMRVALVIMLSVDHELNANGRVIDNFLESAKKFTELEANTAKKYAEKIGTSHE